MSFDVGKGPLCNQPPQHMAAQRLIIQCPGRHHPRMQISIRLPIGVHVHATDTFIGIVKHCPREAVTGSEMPSVPTHVVAVACQIKRIVEWWPPVPRKAPGGTNVLKRSRPRTKVGLGMLLAERLEAQHPTWGIHRRRFGNREIGRNEGTAVSSFELLNHESFFLYVVVHQTSLRERSRGHRRHEKGETEGTRVHGWSRWILRPDISTAEALVSGSSLRSAEVDPFGGRSWLSLASSDDSEAIRISKAPQHPGPDVVQREDTIPHASTRNESGLGSL